MARKYGAQGDDLIKGTDTWDHLFGGLGNDTYLAGSGHDVMWDKGGSDYMDGGAGNDILNGNTKAGEHDIYVGGEGMDVFVINDKGGTIVIKDFILEQGDTLRLDGSKDSKFDWYPTGIGTMTAEWGETTVLFEGVSSRELSYYEAFE